MGTALLMYGALFAQFFKIGLFAIGGGLATLPFLYQLAGNFPLQTFSADEIPTMLAVAQLLPGAVGLNLAGYTGLHISIFGAYLAVLGMITPQITVITLIARVYESFNKNTIIKRIFITLAPAASGLLCSAGFSIWKLSLVNTAAAVWYKYIDIRKALIFLAVFILLRKTKIHPAFFIFGAAGLGILLKI
ncbi:MAG: chromate transporter [Spirochaetaceae bacterium]|jgi:chromate transporter|nr:chromate transporter [Spirochaetaceae bacterium]